MKKINLVFVAAICFVFFLGSCRDDDTFQEVTSEVFVGDLLFQSQSDFDIFQENGYTKIIGNVSILDNVSSLVPLSTLESIQGDLLIKNTQLFALDGLENLTSISGELIIISDLNEDEIPIQNIFDFCALQNLLSEGEFGAVIIEGNIFNPDVEDIINGNCLF